MPISVEARGVYVSDRLSELFLTSAHLPTDFEFDDFRALVAKLLDVAPTTILSPIDLQQVFNENRRVLRRVWDWNGQEPELAKQFIRATALGNLDGRVSVEWPMHPGFYPEWELTLRDTRLGAVRARLALDLATRLQWAPGLDPEMDGDLGLLFEHEVPISQSPKVRGMTVADLVANARSIALVPMAAGALVTPGALACGNWMLALLAPLAGGGAGVVLAGSLLLVDRLLSGVKMLDFGLGGKKKPRLKLRPKSPRPEQATATANDDEEDSEPHQ